jgi:hypothetical protein
MSGVRGRRRLDGGAPARAVSELAPQAASSIRSRRRRRRRARRCTTCAARWRPPRTATAPSRPPRAHRHRRARALEARGFVAADHDGARAYTWYSDVRSTQPSLPPQLRPPPGAPPSGGAERLDAGTINALFSQPIDLSGELRETLKAAQGRLSRRVAAPLGDRAGTGSRS